ncbi:MULTISPECIES: transcriptional regulator [Bacillus]|uniref:transcriptional regulator n=1 Tax=Bacillus TaxID=1386 RepID=UPI000D01A55C|nr:MULTISPECIES: transcriptional regulator [Bacillus]MDR0127033.1 transcriptional regulator [Bacillus zhangzhouensis]PRO41296.1 transcriptional regulator [Bacillus sp. LLTC93]
MLWYETASITEKKASMKRIEFHLKNFKNYQAAILNIERKLEKRSTHHQDHMTRKKLEEQKSQYELIVACIETALKELDDIEQKLIDYKYFRDWRMAKCAIEIGYSEKTLFLMKRQLMDQLLISLAAITNI